MATISPAVVDAYCGSAKLFKWASVTESDTLVALVLPEKSDKTVHVEGSLGGGTLYIEGTLMPVTPSYRPLHNPLGDVISYVAADLAAGKYLRVILENVISIKPRFSGASGASVDIYLYATGR